MFQFSTLLTRQDAGTRRRRPSAADSEAVSSSARANEEDSLTNAAGQCVSDRVRRDLDDQMYRLSELLDRVESLEFEREAEAADIFALGKTDPLEEPAGQARIFDEIEATPGTDDGSPAPYATAEGDCEVFSTERAGCDESLASCVVLTPIIPLSTSEIESLTAPSVICNSPGAALLDKQSCTEPIATETRQIEMPGRVDEAPAPISPRNTKPTFICREAERPVTPSTPADAPISSGVVQDYRPTPPRAIAESTPALETGATCGCLTSGTDEATSSAGANRPSSFTPDCPTPSPIQALASSHSHARSRPAQVEATKHDSPIVPPHRSLRRTLAIELPPASDTVSLQPFKFGGSQILNILAVIGGLLTLSALAYVASDLASWFGPIR